MPIDIHARVIIKLVVLGGMYVSGHTSFSQAASVWLFSHQLYWPAGGGDPRLCLNTGIDIQAAATPK
jgi:hypothetical protein